MTDLFENAVASIRMGVEDFQRNDPYRDISAVRNFYAGVLLLAKEALIRAVPDADPDLVIGARVKPVPDGDGGIVFEQVGNATVDFAELGRRAADFGIHLDAAALKTLNRIRNEMEHRCSTETPTAIRAAISKAFPVAAALFRHLEEDPVDRLGEAWTIMLETKEFYDAELKAAQKTLAGVKWHAPSVAETTFECGACGSELVEQIDPENERQEFMELRCKSCGKSLPADLTIEKALEETFDIDAYIRAKEGDHEGPLYQCNVCNRTTIVEMDMICAACGEPVDYESECKLCHSGISIQEYLDGLDDGLCSYCNYRMEKLRNE